MGGGGVVRFAPNPKLNLNSGMLIRHDATIKTQNIQQTLELRYNLIDSMYDKQYSATSEGHLGEVSLGFTALSAGISVKGVRLSKTSGLPFYLYSVEKPGLQNSFEISTINITLVVNSNTGVIEHRSSGGYPLFRGRDGAVFDYDMVSFSLTVNDDEFMVLTCQFTQTINNVLQTYNIRITIDMRF